MNILLFNDNPVVRKLVALSAQKTKDDLSVVWSIDEIEESGYDLLIIDDALYSDEMFAAIKETVTFKATLLMATRGNAVPGGFDHVINKPFLPTDLVDLFAKINMSLASKVSGTAADSVSSKEEPYLAIDLEESLLDLEPVHDEESALNQLSDTSNDLDLDDFSDDLASFEHEEFLPAVLDHEEVEEVRGLLEDTENDELLEDEESLSAGSGDFDFGELDMPEEETKNNPDLADFEGADLGEEPLSLSEKSDEEPLSDDDFDFGELDMPEEETKNNLDLADFEGADLEDEIVSDDEELMNDEVFSEEGSGSAEEEPLSDEAFDDLELQIQEAVDELEPADLDMEFDDTVLDGLDIEYIPSDEAVSLAQDFKEVHGFDELDMLNERDLKLAIGEEVEEDEPVIHVGESEHAALNSEALDEAVELSEYKPIETADVQATHAEGVEALQTLLKALANEDVAKSLKGLNISININFGDTK